MDDLKLVQKKMDLKHLEQQIVILNEQIRVLMLDKQKIEKEHLKLHLELQKCMSNCDECCVCNEKKLPTELRIATEQEEEHGMSIAENDSCYAYPIAGELYCGCRDN